jgi:hypothetical protein
MLLLNGNEGGIGELVGRFAWLAGRATLGGWLVVNMNLT